MIMSRTCHLGNVAESLVLCTSSLLGMNVCSLLFFAFFIQQILNTWVPRIVLDAENATESDRQGPCSHSLFLVEDTDDKQVNK